MRNKKGQFLKGHSTSPSTEFKKGCIPKKPIQKGERRGITTEFKKGAIPLNKLPVGSITTRERKNRVDPPRKWIKVKEPSVWILLANYVWFENGGNIPKGFITHHIDKNTLNDDISNLSLMKRTAHINLHREDLVNGQNNKDKKRLSSET